MSNFDAIDLDKDMDKIYELMNDKNLDNKRKKESDLNKLRTENHKRFYKINIAKLENLPESFKDIVSDVSEKYKSLAGMNLLSETLKEAKLSQKALNDIYRKIGRIDKMVKSTVRQLEEENDKEQDSFSIIDLKNLDLEKNRKRHILNLYNEVILYNSTIEKDLYSKLKRELVRKEYLSEIKASISLGNTEKINFDKKDKISDLNNKLSKIIDDTSDKIQYLTDLMIEDSDYTGAFNDFLEFYNKITSYDKNDYDNVRQTYEILNDKDKIDSYIKKFENDFINERSKFFNDEKFIFKKIGLKNIKSTLYYISANYINELNKYQKRVIKDAYDKLAKDNIDVAQTGKNLKYIVNDIWKKTITDIYKFNENRYSFLCSNSQFIEPKMETILLSNDIVNRMDNYLDYQIGFICSYDNNILFVTEDSDIMNVEHDDLSCLKTPKQIEKEYLSFDIINRVVLNGYKTKIIGVYYIYDGDNAKYNKALELSKNNKLPLITLKKK